MSIAPLSYVEKLNSEKVTKEALKVGDEIRLGKTVLVVKGAVLFADICSCFRF